MQRRGRDDDGNNTALIVVALFCIVTLAVGAGVGIWWWSRKEKENATATTLLPTYAPAAVQQVTSPPPENPSGNPTGPPAKPKKCCIKGGSGPGLSTPPNNPNPPKKKPPKGGDQGGNNGYKDFLSKLNELRAKHDAPPVEWDPKLAAYAQAWSEKCCPKELKHSGGAYGENLAMGWWASPDDAAMQSLMMWYNEKDQIKPGTDPKNYFDLAGHFTALVWVNTRKVGLGAFKRGDGAMIVTASFDPPGNYTGQFAQNVLKATS